MEKVTRTEISELGEFGLIDRINSSVKPANKTTIKGIGDDAAVLEFNENEYVVVTTDMLVEGIHFDLRYVPLKHLGYKSVAVNISDIAAMNARPTQITISLGISNRFSVEAIDEIYEGIKAACESYNVDLVGGDTTSSPSGLIINITALGTVEKQKVVYRSTAKVGDLVCVTGDLGGAYMGLQILEREKEAYLANPDIKPDLEDKQYILQKQLKPEARMDLIHEFREIGLIPTSMIDISDGLASEIMHICKNSSLGALIYEDKLPIDQLTFDTAREFEIDPTTCALNGGEDYELLFTISQADYEKIKNHPDITIIGHMVEKDKGVKLITVNNNAFPIKAQGWTHF